MATSSKTSRSPIDALAVTTNVAFPLCAGLLVSADVTATVTMASGNAVSMPLQKGYNPIQATKVVFASGTVVALYN
jgi:hypothetical protein